MLISFSCSSLLFWSCDDVVAKCGRGKAFFNIIAKSQSFSGPVSLGYDFHKCFPSGILFFIFPPCILFPYLAIAFLLDIFEILSPVDNVFPLFGETQKVEDIQVGGMFFC